MGIDLIMGDDGDLQHVTQLGTGLAEIAQRVQIRLNTQLGGWPLDPSKGIDYQGFQQEREVDVKAIGGIIKAEIETTPGVVTVLEWSGVHDILGRSLTYTGQVVTDEGEADLLVGASAALEGNATAHVTVHFIHAGRIVGGI